MLFRSDEVLVIMERGKIVRSSVSEVNLTGRNTQGVTFAKPDTGDRIIAITRNVEQAVNGQDASAEAIDGDGEPAAEGESAPSPASDDESEGGAAPENGVPSSDDETSEGR